MKKKSFISINKRLCIAFITITTVTVVATSIFLVVIFSNIMKKRIVEDQKIFLKQNRTNVEDLINTINQISINLSSDTIISDILNKTYIDPLEKYNNIDKITQQFNRYVNVPLSNHLTTYYSNLYLFDNFEISKMLASKDIQFKSQIINNVYSIKSVRNEEWVEETIKMDGTPYTFTTAKDDDTVYIARLIKNINILTRKNDIAMGIMVIGISTDQFAKQVEALSLTPKSSVYIISNMPNRKQIIYSDGSEYFETSIVNDSKIASLEEFKEGQTAVICNKEYLFMKYTTHLDWDIISLIPFSDVSKEIKPTIWIALIISLIGIIVGVILITLVSYTITKPLKQLTHIMHTIDNQEDISVYPRINTKRCDEVSLLYESFDKMMKRIQLLIHNVYIGGIKQKEAELLVLQAQINPHFIYNTLDSINWIAMCNNNDDIVEIVSSLADIVRYSIKNSYEKVMLRDELLHVENYIKIQTKQSRYPISIIFDINEQYLKFIMPKFLIEPLVENSVLHGLKNNVENGRIIISCETEDNVVIIRVIDNGDGADVSKLNEYIRGEIDFLAHSDGFGIKNVNDRIKLNYGDNYGLTFLQNKDRGITAKISLPYESTIIEKSKNH